MQPNELLVPLRRLRRWVRALLVLDAISRLLAAGILAFALLVVLDWWVRFPALVRGGLFVCGLAWLLVSTGRRVLRPVFGAIPLQELAVRLGSLPPEERDRWASVVAYLEHGGGGSRELWRRIAMNPGRNVSGGLIGANLDARRPLRAAAWAGIALLSVCSAMYLAPDLARTGWQRFARPMSAVQWPRRTVIQPITGDALVARGESFSVAMRLSRGDGGRVRAFVQWQGSSASPQRAMMRRDDQGLYRHVLENLQDDVAYSFVAGDDDTAARPFRLRVVERPAVSSAELIITPPSYVREAAPLRRPADGRVSVVTGSRLRWEIVPTKTVVTSSSAQQPSGLLADDGRSIGLSKNEQNGTLWTEMTAQTDGAWRIVLVDELGLHSREGPRTQLEVRPDMPPVVELRRPAAVLEVLPKAMVELVATARDDLGIVSLALWARVRSGTFERVADLLPAARPHPASSGEDLTADHEWSLTSMRLTPGELVEYYVEATDCFAHDGLTHPPVRTVVQRLHVLSEGQFNDRMARDVASAAERLRRMLSALESSAQQTRILRSEAGETAHSARQQRLIEELTDGLRRTLETSRLVGNQFSELAARASLNQLRDSEAARQAERMARTLSGSLADEVKTAAEELAIASDATEGEERRQRLAGSADAQERAAGLLRTMVERFEQWSSFDEVARRLQETLDRQEGLARQLGRRASVDDHQRQVEQLRLAREQSVLQMDASKLLDAMRQLGRKLQGVDSAAAQSLQKAVELGRARTVPQLMADAAEMIRLDRMQAAVDRQEAASSALRAMISAMNERITRELEQLSRSARDARHKLAKMIAAQEDVLRRTREATGRTESAAAMMLAAERQDSLLASTRLFLSQRDLGGADAEDARKSVAVAAEHMCSAVRLLQTGEGLAAVESQTAALAELRAAMDLLNNIADKAQQELAEKSLAAIVAELMQIREAQATLRNETARVAADDGHASAVTRADGLRMNRLARRQRGIRAPLDEVRGKLSSAAVYDYVCGQASAEMSRAADELASRRPEEALACQDRVLRDLSRLIDAAEEPPENRDEAKFVEAEGTGGGADRPTADKPIPTLAELRMLRLIQVDLNDRTIRLHARLPDELRRTEEHLKEVEELGAAQRNIRELTMRMIEKARAPGGS